MTRIAFTGHGNMGCSLVGGLLRTGWPTSTIIISEPREKARQDMHSEFGVAGYAES